MFQSLAVSIFTNAQFVPSLASEDFRLAFEFFWPVVFDTGFSEKKYSMKDQPLTFPIASFCGK